ncbi:MAG: SDR family NAD(P)-dependent oxidoreductase [Anaeroplasmataceae bacterium]
MKVLVTGSSKGIGKAIALEFLKNGHNVIGFDILESSIDEPNYTHYVCNILDDYLPAINDVEILINNAGVQTMSVNDIKVNLEGTIKITEKYAFNDNIKAVVNIASSSASTGSEFPHYAASKGGLLAYTKNIALRLACFGATANSISPGGVITDLNEHIINNPLLWDEVMNETLLKKWASVEEIAKWVYFVAVINKSMTGEDIFIDNGEKIKANFVW